RRLFLRPPGRLHPLPGTVPAGRAGAADRLRLRGHRRHHQVLRRQRPVAVAGRQPPGRSGGEPGQHPLPRGPRPPHHLPAPARRIISRPRRFDRILRIDAPDTRQREAYFARKLPELSAAELEHWVQLTDGLPFAALAELVISVCCLENGLEETVELLRSLDQHTPSSCEFANNGAVAEAQ